MELRIGGERDPFLRRRVPRERVAWTWVGADGAARLRDRIEGFREELRAAGPGRRAATAAKRGAGESGTSGAAAGDR